MDRAPRFDHLARLTTATGLYEHALGTQPRVASGMCVDDVARALVVTAREPRPSPRVADMARVYLAFLRDAQREDGRMHNRRDAEGRWLDEQSTDDHWGRAVWAFAVAATRSADPGLAHRARRAASTAMAARSEHPRAMAYAALGAFLLLEAAPHDEQARHLLLDARAAMPMPGQNPAWPWPYERLSYANAVLPEAMIAVGSALADEVLCVGGLRLLHWLVAEQTVDDHLSVVPAGGRGPGDVRPAFDQQPIEVAALAEAAGTAFAVTRDDRWVAATDACRAWFEGANDTGLPMRDEATGGGFDGLEPAGVNRNQGAESTLAWLATAQLASAVHAVAVP